MDPEEKHFPPGAEPATPAKEPETPKADPAPEAEPVAEPKVETPEPKAEEPKPDETAPNLPKKRSIYDDLKDKKQEVKEVTRTAAAEKARADAAEAKASELQALLDAKKDAVTPADKEAADDDLKKFADDEGITPEQIERLAQIVAKHVPKQEIPEGMTAEELADWRASRATAKQADEDQQVLAAAPTVKKELSVQDDAELANVMKEVVRLAHTPEFYDKEVEYIVWKNKDALSKLVSPKKPAAEAGGRSNAEGSAEEIDFSSGTVTPAQAQKAIVHQKSSYEIREAK